MDDTFSDFLQIESLAELHSTESLDMLGGMVDRARDEGNQEVLEHVIKLADTVTIHESENEHEPLVDYYVANAWDGLKQIRSPEPGGSWEWEQPESERILFHLRRARRSSGFAKLSNIRKCQISTNEGNCLSNLGRFVEAIDPWETALAIDPNFGMARGNLGIGLWTYAKSVYDKNHRMILANAAWPELQLAISHGVNSNGTPYFQQSCEEIEAVFHKDVLRHKFDLNDHKIGESDDERKYRKWCIKHRLFINPINDFGAFNVAAHDVLTCPSVVTGIDEGPIYHGFFNQMKQEYCSARWLAYEGIMLPEPHFSDAGVLLYNTLDYPSYSLSTEKLKLAFRSLYSLFDKIAFFLNAYLKLNIPGGDVSFRRLWYEKAPKRNRTRLVRAELRERQNLAFRGLFWLAKDLFEARAEFQDVMDPDARQLDQVRNHLEHKYLKLHQDMWRRPESDFDDSFGFTDSLAYSITRAEFERMVYRLLSLSRAALIYLAIGTHREERVKAQTRDPDSPTVAVELEPWEDEWKR